MCHCSQVNSLRPPRGGLFPSALLLFLDPLQLGQLSSTSPPTPPSGSHGERPEIMAVPTCCLFL